LAQPTAGSTPPNLPRNRHLVAGSHDHIVVIAPAANKDSRRSTRRQLEDSSGPDARIRPVRSASARSSGCQRSYRRDSLTRLGP
jgi:hypothetical protein